MRQQLLGAVSLLGALEAGGAVLGDDGEALPLGELAQLPLPHVHQRPVVKDEDKVQAKPCAMKKRKQKLCAGNVDLDQFIRIYDSENYNVTGP